jgi:Zn finger protein HypA/HybF involved in hydrogenase expression
MWVAKVKTYTITCRFCRSELLLDFEEIDFHGATSKTCPACGNRVKITDDYGMAVPGLEAEDFNRIPE